MDRIAHARPLFCDREARNEYSNRVNNWDFLLIAPTFAVYDRATAAKGAAGDPHLVSSVDRRNVMSGQNGLNGLSPRERQTLERLLRGKAKRKLPCGSRSARAPSTSTWTLCTGVSACQPTASCWRCSFKLPRSPRSACAIPRLARRDPQIHTDYTDNADQKIGNPICENLCESVDRCLFSSSQCSPCPLWSASPHDRARPFRCRPTAAGGMLRARAGSIPAKLTMGPGRRLGGGR